MKGIKHINIQRHSAGGSSFQNDAVVEELPLQIQLSHGMEGDRKTTNLSVTMRTPGDDHNLVTGFLFCEGIIQNAGDIMNTKQTDENTLLAELAPHVKFDTEKQKRNFVASSACGFCGKTSADILPAGLHKLVPGTFKVQASLLQKLPLQLHDAQNLFTKTGGAHAVALFNAHGEQVHISEDVGRHNAMDKLVGAMLSKNALPLSGHIVLFSGRLGYELVQKTVAAGIPAICAIGAPTSIAIEVAEDYGVTVIGFLKEKSFNIYCGAHNIIDD